MYTKKEIQVLLDQFTLLDLTEYQGRRRVYKEAVGSVIANLESSVEYEPFTIEAASLQPISGKTLNALPEGYRSKAQYSFWTKTEMRGLQQGTEQLSDQILIDGKWYSVYSLKDWTRTSFLVHHHCVAILDDQNNSWSYGTEGGNFG